MDKPTKQYIKDLIIDTVKAVTHLDTKILTALAPKNISQVKTSNTKNILFNALLHVIKKNRS
jgi:hypothetical protein